MQVAAAFFQSLFLHMEPVPETKAYPFYLKATVILTGLAVLVFILHVLQAILVPFGMATLFAILLNPLNSRLERRLPRVIAVAITVLLALAVFAGVLYLLSTQIVRFGDMLPELKLKSAQMLAHMQEWLKQHFGISTDRQQELLQQTTSKKVLGRTIGSIMGTLGLLLLIPFYIFLLLFYKPLILDFLFQVFSEKYSLRVAEILGQTKAAIQSYVVGLMIETVIVATLNSVALLIIGVPYAVLIGIMGGLLNILPYIGGLVAIALPVLMATVTKDGYTAQLAVIGAYSLIQLIDNNFLVPRIVSSKVQINALLSVITVLLGGALWGIAGMFLSIPFMGFLKIIFDRIDEMKPWGLLLGDKVPEEHTGVVWQKRWTRILRKRSKAEA
jgi:predicted PurR-regulated permease PerM